MHISHQAYCSILHLLLVYALTSNLLLAYQLTIDFIYAKLNFCENRLISGLAATCENIPLLL